jgi:hypothetical protein
MEASGPRTRSARSDERADDDHQCGGSLPVRLQDRRAARTPVRPRGPTDARAWWHRFATTNLDHRVKGESYKSELYEAAIGRAFEHVAISARLKAATVADATRPDPETGDVLALARINRERGQAALRFARDRDIGTLEATMARLDAVDRVGCVQVKQGPRRDAAHGVL